MVLVLIVVIAITMLAVMRRATTTKPEGTVFVLPQSKTDALAALERADKEDTTFFIGSEQRGAEADSLAMVLDDAGLMVELRSAPSGGSQLTLVSITAATARWDTVAAGIRRRFESAIVAPLGGARRP